MSSRLWSEEHQRIVREGYAAGTPVAELAAATGRSFYAVYAWANACGLRHGKPADTDRRLRQAWKAMLPEMKRELREDILRIMAE